jgi:hypothetical protein
MTKPLKEIKLTGKKSDVSLARLQEIGIRLQEIGINSIIILHVIQLG